jgi:hypothetical protein
VQVLYKDLFHNEEDALNALYSKYEVEDLTLYNLANQADKADPNSLAALQQLRNNVLASHSLGTTPDTLPANC